MHKIGFVIILVLLSFSSVFAINGNMGNHDGYVPTGSQAAPWRIEDKADFKKFCSSSTYWATGVYTNLMADITFTSPTDDFTTSPVGGSNGIYSGIFNGNSKTIDKIKISKSGSSITYCGIFGQVGSGGVVANLNVTGASVSYGFFNTGIICGSNSGKIINCHVAGTVSSDNDTVGGVCGRNIYTGTITRCSSSCEIIGDWLVGGLCGENNGVIKDSYTLSSVTGNLNVGGLVGRNFETIENCFAAGMVSGNSAVGGLCGDNFGNSDITHSFWDINSSGMATSDGGVGLTTAQMADINTFLNAGWDFVGEANNGQEDFWLMNGYPDLVRDPINIIVMPNIVGLSQTNAIALLTALGLQVHEIRYSFSSTPADNICTQEPVAGALTKVGGDVIYTVSLGAIPNLVGLTQVEAEALLTSRGFLSGTIDYVFDNTIPAGQVKSQYSPVGAITERVRTISYTVSLGAIPTLVGLTQEEADALLTSRGFVSGVITYVFDNLRPRGQVISQVAPTGSISDKARVFSYTVSLGVNNGLSGSGTKASPYLITDIADLIIFGKGSDYGKSGVYIRLTSDINLKGAVTAPIISAFSGTFDGNGHVIRNYVSTGGLFSSIGSSYSSATVLNLGIEDAVITTTGSTVGILCNSNKGTIVNCYTTGSISGGDTVGGLCGDLNDGDLETCYSRASVTGNSNVGGLCGKMSSYSPSVHSCYYIGQVTGTTNVGGLCGYAYDGQISESYARGAVSGSSCVGGLCGYSPSAQFDDSYSACQVVGTTDVGGFCGKKDTFSHIYYSFWDVEASGVATDAGATGLTTEQMQDKTTYLNAGWDFNDESENGTAQIWYMNQYPELVWDIVAMPSVYGALEADAKTILVNAGLNVGSVTYSLSLYRDPGYIDSISGNGSLSYPKAGASIGLVVSIEKVPGSGTAADPFLIGDFRIYKFVFFERYSPLSYYKLTNDIDLSPELPGRSDDINPVIPGVQTVGTIERFYGVLDGDGFAIKNFTGSQGLFGTIVYFGGGGIVKNLGMEGVNISGDIAGAICGTNQGLIQNCYATGTVNGSSIAGGICGVNDNFGNKSTISGCYSAVNVTCANMAGGLCGKNSGAISDSYSTGNVVSTGNTAGGFCGYNYDFSSSIKNCYSTGTVSCAGMSVGGFCGRSTGTISSCFWDIQTSGKTTSSGGTGLTSEQMQDMETFQNAGWDFYGYAADGIADLWYFDQHPVLQWQVDFEQVVLPDMMGITLDNIDEALADIGCYVKGVTFAYSNDNSPKGQVIGQTPVAGASVNYGSGVELVVSYGALLAGSGTEAAPYLIDGFVDFMQFKNMTQYRATGVYVSLLSDIDLDPALPGRANYSEALIKSFSGIFRGNGKVIRNLKISNTSSNLPGIGGQSGIGGLFADVYGSISDLGLENVNIVYNSNLGTGALCGYCTGTINNCYSTGIVSGYFNVGGLIGLISNGSVNNCYSMARVVGSDYAGGLIGYVSRGQVRNCYAVGPVFRNSTMPGNGLFGQFQSGATVQNCFWDTQSSGTTSNSGGGTGLTTMQMQDMEIFQSVGWDFNTETANGTADLWHMPFGVAGYPKLWYQRDIPGDISGSYGVDMADFSALSTVWGNDGVGLTDLEDMAFNWLAGK